MYFFSYILYPYLERKLALANITSETIAMEGGAIFQGNKRLVVTGTVAFIAIFG